MSTKYIHHIHSPLPNTYKYIQGIFPEVRLLEETKNGGKEEKNDTE
jgi:hypothetical protein